MVTAQEELTLVAELEILQANRAVAAIGTIVIVNPRRLLLLDPISADDRAELSRLRLRLRLRLPRVPLPLLLALAPPHDAVVLADEAAVLVERVGIGAFDEEEYERHDEEEEGEVT